MIEQWRAALTAMAAFPNVHVKISGLGMYQPGLTQPQARQVIRDTIQIFGAERTIYGSNFPLEKLHASYADFFAHYRKVLSEYTEAEQRAVLHDNAASVLPALGENEARFAEDHRLSGYDVMTKMIKESHLSLSGLDAALRSSCWGGPRWRSKLHRPRAARACARKCSTPCARP